jgi:heme exporter protein D
MSVAIPPLHQYAFMAWCSVKSTVTTLLYLIIVCVMRIGKTCNSNKRKYKRVKNFGGENLSENSHRDDREKVG